VQRIHVADFAARKIGTIGSCSDFGLEKLKLLHFPAVTYTATVRNCTEAQVAVDLGIDELCFDISASETYNSTCSGMSREESVDHLVQIMESIRGKAKLNVFISCAFGCPQAIDSTSQDVIDVGDCAWNLGVQVITLCDTSGEAGPIQVEKLSDGLPERWPDTDVALRLQHARGLGLVNVVAALATGISHFVVSADAYPATTQAADIPIADLLLLAERLSCHTEINMVALDELVSADKHSGGEGSLPSFIPGTTPPSL
jgi:isopropylmalate/homocitrate/citramalate synthase